MSSSTVVAIATSSPIAVGQRFKGLEHVVHAAASDRSIKTP
ncbi:hypothetical protein OG410_41635 [Streptomyces sp. NBC_00659]|nr:hypothetical protein [Streptomyces sp. NBC_00659]